MNKRWKILTSGPSELALQLAKEINVHPAIASILIRRGISTFEAARHFFRPGLEHLYDPFRMKDMDRAIARIMQALQKNEKILIYGDYDVDGTTAVALVYSFFRDHFPDLVTNNRLDYYIPDRYKEGYGISTAGIDFAAANGFGLIIALDCGIKAIEKVEYANSRGIDFIICDHHLPGSSLPKAAAVLDPKRGDCPYPFKELSGCGIGFKLAQALTIQFKIPAENLHQYLDLVAISIAADIVPITDENRILAYHGLKQLNQSPREGIRAMLELNNIKKDKEITINEIVFFIGPRINAAGRMESGRKAVELLISSSAEKAIESGSSLNKNNLDRRDLDQLTTQQALKMIQDNPALQNQKTTVLFDPGWHKGVIGIVASRLTESYYRPTIMLTQSNGMVSGSARSVKDFDIYQALEACSDLLEQFGGHKFAAGLSLKPENVETFKTRFEAVVSSTITEEMLIPEIEIDAELPMHEITPGFYNIVRQFAPFGPGNMSPVFLSRKVSDRGYANIVGSNHLKMDITQSLPEGSGKAPARLPAIGFGMAGYFEYIAKRNPFDVCYCIQEQEWEGNRYIQLQVKDIKKPH